jgi:ClpP class serine protease
MKPPLHRIASRLLAEPWLMRRDKYNSVVAQFLTHAGTRADMAVASWWEPNRDPFDWAIRVTNENCLAKVEIKNGVAILPVDGILGKNLNSLEANCGGYDVNVLACQAMALMARPDVKTVVLWLNTPGGAAAGVADVANVLLTLGQTKRLIAYCDDACSGGYWIACCADEIYCGESAMVGSISALCAFEDVSKMYEDLGVKTEVFTDGALKGAGVPGTSLTEEQRADIQSRIDYIGGKFKTFVKTRRPMLTDEHLQGQWFYGDAALQIGMVDALAPTLEHVVAFALN